jgi:hypothetical protein
MRYTQTIDIDTVEFDKIVVFQPCKFLTNQFALRRSYFEKQMKKHGNLDWLIFKTDIDHDEYLVGITIDNLNDYVNNQEATIKWKYLDIVELANENQWDQIIANEDDWGYCHSINGKPILQGVWMDYIQGGCTSKRYKFSQLVAFLKGHPQVSNLVDDEVPYYNAEYSGEKCVEFTFMPTEEEFKKIYKIAHTVGDEQDEVVKILGLKKFLKKKDD